MMWEGMTRRLTPYLIRSYSFSNLLGKEKEIYMIMLLWAQNYVYRYHNGWFLMPLSTFQPTTLVPINTLMVSQQQTCVLVLPTLGLNNTFSSLGFVTGKKSQWKNISSFLTPRCYMSMADTCCR